MQSEKPILPHPKLPQMSARIMLAACLKSAIHMHEALIKEKVIGSETVQDRSLFLQQDRVLLSPEQKAGSNLLTSFKWHHLTPGLAGISKRKYPTPAQSKGMLHPIMVTSLMTPEPCSWAHADLPQVENHRDAGPRARCGISCYGANPAQRVSKILKTSHVFSSLFPQTTSVFR